MNVNCSFYRHTNATNSALRLLLSVNEIRSDNSTLSTSDLLRLLRSRVTVITVINRVDVQVLANCITRDRIRASRGLVCIIRARNAPNITLS